MNKVVKGKRKIENKSFLEEVFDVLFYIPRRIHKKNQRLKYLENEGLLIEKIKE